MSEPICEASSFCTDGIPFQALIENITDAVILADLKGKVIYANHQARAICGLSTLNGSDSSVFRLFPQAQVPQISLQFERALKQETGDPIEIRFGVDLSWFKLTVFPVIAGIVG
ncbi:PAS domain-containing protein, partial [Alteromonadaceae bacterium A_SAG5]|nr:PAS domain-containing protein [Alteromonadaceae bacterium A_SAG5]